MDLSLKIALDHIFDDREPDSNAAFRRFGGEKRLEYARQVFRRDSRARVAYAAYGTAAFIIKFHIDQPRRAFGQRLAGIKRVCNQIRDDVAEFERIPVGGQVGMPFMEPNFRVLST